jgi:mercuric ion transport protein
VNRRPATITLASVVAAAGSASTSVLATLCCVGPTVYGLLGAGGVLAAARLAPWRPWLLAGSAIFLGVGFWSAYRRRARVIDGTACPVQASRVVRTTLWVAAALTVAAAAIPAVLS